MNEFAADKATIPRTAGFDDWCLRRAFAMKGGRAIKGQKHADRSEAGKSLNTLESLTDIIDSREGMLNVLFKDTIDSWKYMGMDSSVKFNSPA